MWMMLHIYIPSIIGMNVDWRWREPGKETKTAESEEEGEGGLERENKEPRKERIVAESEEERVDKGGLWLRSRDCK